MTQYIILSKQFYKIIISISLKPPPLSNLQLDIKPIIYAYDLKLIFNITLSIVQNFIRSLIRSEAKWLRLLTFIFYSIVVVLECANFVLLGSAKICQPRTINESY